MSATVDTMPLPEDSGAAMAVLTDVTTRERAARRAADGLLSQRDELIAEAVGRKDISKVELERELGLRRQWLYQIAERAKKEVTVDRANVASA